MPAREDRQIPTGSPHTGSGRLRIGFAICDPGLSFGAIVRLGASERAAELGVDLSVISVFTPQEQAAVIERFVRHAVDALIVEALESRVVLPALNHAAAAGIPVVVADMGISDAHAVCAVRSDNVKGGEIAAAYLVERLGGSGRIAHLRGMPTSENGLDRTRGMHNVLDRHPGIEIVFEGTCEWTREAGTAVMREVLAHHQSLGVVFGGNDPLALGAMDAIADAGRTGEIVVVGFDALPDALLAIEQGTMSATVRQAPRSIGRQAVEAAVQAVRGEAVPQIIQTEVALVTSADVADASLAALPLFPRVLRDLTNSLEALSEERSLLRTLIDNLPDLIYVKDQASRFVLVNPGLMELIGARTPEEVIGKTDFDFFPPELASQYYADEQAIIATGEPLISHEERSVAASGQVRWFSTTKVPAHDESGAFVGLVGLNRDVTERKQFEAERERREEALRRSQEQLSTALQHILEVENERAMWVALEETHRREERRRLASELHDSVSQALFSMNLHTRALQLMVSQRRGDSTQVANGLAELRELTQIAISEMRALIFQLRPNALEEGGLVTAVRRHGAAVAAREGFEVRVDVSDDRLPLDPRAETELFRVIQEALHNTVKHAHPTCVEIRLIEPPDAVRTLIIEVADDGVGFDPTTRHPGHLGLDTMRERAERLGGRFTVDSSPAGSTTVRVVLPDILLPHPMPDGTSEPAADPDGPPEHGSAGLSP